MLETCIDNNLTTLTEFHLSMNEGWKEDPTIVELITVIKAQNTGLTTFYSDY